MMLSVLDAIYLRAIELGCFPVHRDGLWRCACVASKHAQDNRSHRITVTSLRDYEARITK